MNRTDDASKFLCDVKTGAHWPLQEELGGKSAFCPSGIRCRGGVNFALGFMWNAGTCRFNVKGETQAGNPCKSLSTDVKHRGGTIRSSDESSVMGVERRGRVVQYCFRSQLHFAGGAQ